MSAGRLNHGGAAFPMPGADYTEDCGDFKRDAYHGPQEGMTLRDYFAAKELTRVHPDQLQVCDHPEAYERLATHCYRMADAMLKARSA
jgi:hypothetical protein